MSNPTAPILTYVWDKDAASINRRLETGRTLTLRADSIRKERTGCHARLFVRLDDTTLAWSNLNVEDDAQRVRLVNSAHKRLLPVDAKVLPASDFKQLLDIFCQDLWDAYVSRYEATFCGGHAVPPPLTYALYPYVLLGGGTMLFAPPGRGKSYTLITMAVSIDAGLDRLWKIERPRRVLLVNLERSQLSIERRICLVNAALGLDPERKLLTINARGRSLRDIFEAIRRSIDRHGVEVLFVDSVSRAGFGAMVKDEVANLIIDSGDLGRFRAHLAQGGRPRLREPDVRRRRRHRDTPPHARERARSQQARHRAGGRENQRRPQAALGGI